MNQVLSSEEVDEILKVTKEKDQDLSTLVGNNENSEQGKHYTYALTNINDLTSTDCEKNLSAFLRKKIVVQPKTSNSLLLSEYLKNDTDKKVYTVFRIMPQDRYGIIAIDLNLIHQSINLLYGGKVNKDDPLIGNSGKVGIITAEKIAQLCVLSLANACQEYGTITCETLKTSTTLNLASNTALTAEDQVYLIELAVIFEEIEMTIKMIIAEDFLADFIPTKTQGNNKHREKDFWRTAIKSQVVDSAVTVNVTLPDVSMKVKDFMELKEGDLIPITDPTLVYICLNNLKLFRATAGQANSKMVAKIVSQI